MIDASFCASRARAYEQWPWQAHRFQLWSLLDMMQFLAKNFYAASLNLERARAFALDFSDMADHRPDVFRHLAGVYNEIIEIPLSKSLREQVWRVMSAPDDINVVVLQTQVNEIMFHLGEELMEHLFLFVPSTDKKMFLHPERWFGEQVATSFPEARRDMRDCARCLALDQPTASVYHAMCVVQHGLRRLADRLQVPFAQQFEVLTWNDVLNGIDGRLKVMRGQPKTPALDAEIHLGTRATSHFFSIREAWRNYVMHARERYDKQEAERVTGAVKAIMEALAQ